MTGTKLIDDRYLGDGVYASFDGWHIVLDLRGQDEYTKIALDRGVLEGLKKFEQDLDIACGFDAAKEKE